MTVAEVLDAEGLDLEFANNYVKNGNEKACGVLVDAIKAELSGDPPDMP